MHLGILLEFPIPHFALGVMSIYTLMVPVRFWDKIIEKITGVICVNNNREVLYENTNNIQLSKVILKILIGICVLVQINITLQSPLVSPLVNCIGSKLHVKKHYELIAYKLSIFSRKTLGVTKHPVFMDNHFVGYNHILKVTYIDHNLKETTLPIINEQGMPGNYLTGGVWVNWSYRTNSPNVNIESLKKGMIAYTSYWAHNNEVNLLDAHFKISVKRIELPSWNWEKDYLEKQLNLPWETAGALVWENDKPELELIKDIEKF